MSFKEEKQKEKLALLFIFCKKIHLHLNRVDIHVIYVKMFLTKMDI